MQIYQINDLTNTYIMGMLMKQFSLITDPASIKNYHPDFTDTPSNIFYILKNGRYRADFGKYFVIEEDGEYICSAGWNKYDLEEDIALVLTRAYVSKKFRTTYIMGEKLLPMMLQDCADIPRVWITCNEQNKAIYQWFSRVHSGKQGAIIKDWPNIYRRFEPIGKKTVYFTEQYIAQLKRET